MEAKTMGPQAGTVKVSAAVLVAASLLLTSCSRTGDEPGEGPEAGGAGGFETGSLVSVSLSADTAHAEDLFTEQIKDSNFEPDVQVAANAAEQQQQISSMLNGKLKVLIVDAADPAGLGEQLAAAEEARIPVIAYDTMVTDTAVAKYLVSVDAFQNGQTQAQALLDGLAERHGEGPYNVELFSGHPSDRAARLAFDGVMNVLQPKIDEGTVAVMSGQTDYEATASESPEAAGKRLTGLLADNYASHKLDGILAADDATAQALIRVAQDGGQDSAVVVGSGSAPEGVKSVMAGKQYATTYAGQAAMVAEAMTLVKGFAQDDAPEADDEDSYGNDQTTVAAYLTEAEPVTQLNAHKVFADNPELSKLAE
jgi:putative multiple sugar transport system substrate-binding protein